MFALALGVTAADDGVPQFSAYERSFEHAGQYAHPYVELSATATLTEPDGRTQRTLPLFWDGGQTWRLRFSPDKPGRWKWTVRSEDSGLNRQAGEFTAVESELPGGLQTMPNFPRHFQRQNGSPFWFLGDTAWALYTDSDREKHDRAAAEAYLHKRAGQGFNVVHSHLLSEAGWGNSGGPPFTDLASQKINPGYWQEVDRRLRFLNSQGIVGGLALAWGDKRGTEPYAWGRFPSDEARRRYVRYIAARYSAFDVYFLVSGEWHAEIRRSAGSHEEAKAEFIALGNLLRESDPHGRMIGIHPMTAEGSVREFADAPWMSFADYQQNYEQLHQRVLLSLRLNKPVVNSEYAYYLRDQNEDGKTDKPNSATLDMIRHATWDITMAGGYVVTGFGSTYFGGNRHPGPFQVDDPRNVDWERQIQFVKTAFVGLEWWKLTSHDDLISTGAPRSEDRREQGVQAPPQVAYWLLADPGKTYVAYVRGRKGAYKLTLPEDSQVKYRLRQFDPRTGVFDELGEHSADRAIFYTSPDEQDWVFLATAE
jgi:hypothetical protein